MAQALGTDASGNRKMADIGVFMKQRIYSSSNPAFVAGEMPA